MVLKSNRTVEECRLQLIWTPDVDSRPWSVTLAAALDGGVDLVQLRMKQATTRQRVAMARQMVTVTDRFGVRLLINDDIEAVAQLGGAVAGVHLGQEDAPVETARRKLGDAAWIGLSTHSVEEAQAGVRSCATHLGLGACYATTTKIDHHLLDRGVVAAAVALAESAHRPCFAIGGITVENVAELVRSGVRRIAVSAGLLRAADPASAAAALLHFLPATA